VIEDTTEEPQKGRRSVKPMEATPALVIQWLTGAQSVVGGVLFADEAAVFGRGEGESESRAVPVRLAPGENAALGVVAAPWLSRRQLRLQAVGDKLMVENLGRVPLMYRGVPERQVMLKAGERVVLGEPGAEAFGVLAMRALPRVLPPLASWGQTLHRLGEADAVGLVGETPVMWALRDRIAFLARQSGHVLVVGASGSGKERVAQALHHLSPRTLPMVARNAATIPASLMDVELFGHVANFPNPGMRERPGLIGQADGSTLFLDEIGELPHDLQAHLLRLMDSGDYQRLGDPRPRRVDVRVIAATNRPRTDLKPDLVARFRHVIEVPSLSERADDVMLLARHILANAAKEDPLVARTFFSDDEPRLAFELVDALLSHPLPMQVRELEALLWDAITSSVSGAAVGAALRPGPSLSEAPVEERGELTREGLQAALDRNGGNIERTSRELGLKNRYVLRRLMAKHGLVARS
jgi:two-component system nitrogen regulation response regulator GlnG/two-component system response regulator HydG